MYLGIASWYVICVCVSSVPRTQKGLTFDLKPCCCHFRALQNVFFNSYFVNAAPWDNGTCARCLEAMCHSWSHLAQPSWSPLFHSLGPSRSCLAFLFPFPSLLRDIAASGEWRETTQRCSLNGGRRKRRHKFSWLLQQWKRSGEGCWSEEDWGLGLGKSWSRMWYRLSLP